MWHARRPALALRCGVRAATITAIISSPPSWPIICAGTQSGSRRDGERSARLERGGIGPEQALADEVARRTRPGLVGVAAHVGIGHEHKTTGVGIAKIH